MPLNSGTVRSLPSPSYQVIDPSACCVKPTGAGVPVAVGAGARLYEGAGDAPAVGDDEIDAEEHPATARISRLAIPNHIVLEARPVAGPTEPEPSRARSTPIREQMVIYRLPLLAARRDPRGREQPPKRRKFSVADKRAP